MENIPVAKIGIVAVSRDCFPESLAVNRRKALVEADRKNYDAADIYECPICIVESEIHMTQALEDVKKNGCNAIVVYLGRCDHFGFRIQTNKGGKTSCVVNMPVRKNKIIYICHIHAYLQCILRPFARSADIHHITFSTTSYPSRKAMF